MTSLSGAEIALCVVIPLLIVSLVMLVLCYLANRKLLCWKGAEDQALLSSMSSQRSSTIKSSNASSPNEETKYKSNDVIERFNMTITNEQTMTSQKPPPLVRRHSSVTSRSAELPTPPKSPKEERRNVEGRNTTSEIRNVLMTSSPKRRSELLTPMTRRDVMIKRNSDANLNMTSSNDYLSINDVTTMMTSPMGSARSSMEFPQKPETGMSLPNGYHANRRRSSMQVPIDIRSIDPKMYAKMKTESFDAEGIDDPSSKPIINISVLYYGNKEEMVVKLIQARNLESSDGSKITNPYCSVELEPDYVLHWSKVQHGTCDPEFNESFRFPLLNEEIDDKTLLIKLYDWDQFARDECCGVMRLKLKEIDFELNYRDDVTMQVQMWRAVVVTSPSCHDNHKGREDASQRNSLVSGDLMLGLSYLPSAEKLTVTIQRARNLDINGNHKKKIEMYVKCSLMRNGMKAKKKRTNQVIIPSGSQAVFDEALTFGVMTSELDDVIMKCELYYVTDKKVKKKGRISRKELLGVVELSSSTSSPQDRQHWLEMTSSKNQQTARWHCLKRRIESSNKSTTSSDS